MSKLLTLLLATLAALVQPAHAGPWRDISGLRIDLEVPRQWPGRAQRQPAGDSRRAERPPEPARRSDGRLSEEERRELRRDVARASREIYNRR